MKIKAGNSGDSVERINVSVRFGKNSIDQVLLAHLRGYGHTMSTELKRLAYVALTGGDNITPDVRATVVTQVDHLGVQREDIPKRGNGDRFGRVANRTVVAPVEPARSVAAPVAHLMELEDQHNIEPVPQIEKVTSGEDDSQAGNDLTIEYQGDQMVWTQEGSPTSSISDNLGVKLLNF